MNVPKNKNVKKNNCKRKDWADPRDMHSSVIIRPLIMPYLDPTPHVPEKKKKKRDSKNEYKIIPGRPPIVFN